MQRNLIFYEIKYFSITNKYKIPKNPKHISLIAAENKYEKRPSIPIDV